MAERAEDKIRLNKDRQEADRQIRQHIFEAGGQTALDAYNAAMNHLSGKDREEAKRANASKQNRGFTQVYDEGWQRLQGLMKQDSNAARLYAFFAEHMGPDGTLCASRQTLAEALEMGERTISRHVKKLEELNAVVVLKVGSANVYALNPAEVWKSFDNAKPYAAFNTKTLVGKAENPFVKRRLATLMGGKAPEQAELPLDGHAVDWTEAEEIPFDDGQAMEAAE